MPEVATTSTNPPLARATLPDKPLTEFTVEEVGQAILSKQAKEGAVNQKFIDGDHWQGSLGWIGPYPTDIGAAKVRADIQKGFTSRNVILEVTERHSTGVVGREPDWGYAPRRDMDELERPTANETALIDEAEALMTTWWDKRGIYTMLRTIVEYALHQGRGVVRIFVPKGKMVDGVATANSIEEALSLIYVDAPHPREAAVLVNEETMEPVGMYRFSIGNYNYADIYYTDEEDKSVIKRVGGPNPERPEVYTVDIGKRLLMYQLDRRLLITTQVQQQQRGLNLAESMVPRNVITSGFLERIIFNAMLPGHYEDDPEEPTLKRFVPDPYYAGAGTTNFLNGIKFTGRDGEEQVANPTAVFREPIAPKPTIEASSAHYRSILNEVDQLHHLISGDAISSAVSRVEARLDFTKSLTTTQAPTEALGRWILETVLAFAETIANQPGRFTGELQAHFKCRLTAGHLTPEEQTVLIERVDKGLTTKEDAMHLLGVDNVDVAIAKINAQPGSMLGMREKQAIVFKLWLDAGATPEQAARLTGVAPDSEEFKILAAINPKPEPEPNPEPGIEQ